MRTGQSADSTDPVNVKICKVLWKLMDLKTLPNQVRHLDEKRPCVSTKTGEELSRKRVPAVVVQVVVVACIKSGARTRRPAE